MAGVPGIGPLSLFTGSGGAGGQSASNTSADKLTQSFGGNTFSFGSSGLFSSNNQTMWVAIAALAAVAGVMITMAKR